MVSGHKTLLIFAIIFPEQEQQSRLQQENRQLKQEVATDNYLHEVNEFMCLYKFLKSRRKT